MLSEAAVELFLLSLRQKGEKDNVMIRTRWRWKGDRITPSDAPGNRLFQSVGRLRERVSNVIPLIYYLRESSCGAKIF